MSQWPRSLEIHSMTHDTSLQINTFPIGIFREGQ